MTIDMKQVREAAGRRESHRTLVQHRATKLNSPYWKDGYGWLEGQKELDDTILIDFACHVLATSVVVPRELHAEVVEFLLDLQGEWVDAQEGGHECPDLGKLTETIDRLGKLGVSDG